MQAKMLFFSLLLGAGSKSSDVFVYYNLRLLLLVKNFLQLVAYIIGCIRQVYFG